MRKYTIVLAAVLLALSVTASFAFVGVPSPGEFCNANGNFGFDHDTCVVCLNSGGGKGNIASCICKALEDLGELPPGVSHGDCVSFIVSLL